MRRRSQCQRGPPRRSGAATSEDSTGDPATPSFTRSRTLRARSARNEGTDRRRQPLLLPRALTMAGHDTTCAARRMHGVEGISGGARCMVSHVSGPRSLACGSRSRSCRTFRRIPRCSVRLDTRCARHSRGDLPTGPCPSHVDRPPGPVVLRMPRAEQRQHMLRAVRRPDREQTMSVQVKRAPAMNRLEAFVSHRISLFWPALGDQASPVHERTRCGGIPHGMTAAIAPNLGGSLGCSWERPLPPGRCGVGGPHRERIIPVLRGDPRPA
jgi:hypothetical protein